MAVRTEEENDLAGTRRIEVKPKLWTTVFFLIVALTFCCFVMGQGLNSGTSVFLNGRGYGASLAGALALVFSGSAAVARILIGPVIDGGKCSKVVICGIAVLVAGTLLTSVVSDVALYVLCRALQGAGFAAATTAAATAAADVLPEERLGEGIGYYGLGQAIAMSVGPAFALFLVNTDPSTNLFLGLAVVGVIGFVIAWGARYESHPEKLPETSACRMRWEKAGGAADAAGGQVRAGTEIGEAPAKRPGQRSPLSRVRNMFELRALPGAIPMAIICPTFGFGIFFVGLYGTTLGYANAGLFYTISAIAMIAVRLLSRRFMDAVPAIRTYTVAVAVGIVGSVMLFFAGTSEAVFLAAGLPYGVCLGITLPLNQSVAVKNTPSERWGATNALFLLFNDVGIGVSSAIWGAVNDAFGFGVCIVAIVFCQIASYIVAWVVYPADQKR